MHYTPVSVLPALLLSGTLSSCLPSPPKVREIVEIPGVRIENVASRSNGELLLSTMGEAKLYSVNPYKSPPKPEVIAQIEGVNSLFGITEIGDDVFALATGNDTGQQFQNNSMKLSLLKFKHGQLSVDTVFEESKYGPVNGIVALPHYKHIILGADSVRGEILRIDTTTGKVRVAIQDKEFTPIVDGLYGLGVNGIKIYKDYLYFTNTDRQTFGRMKIDKLGNKVGDVEIIYRLEKGSLSIPDDFIMDKNGNAYVGFWQDRLIKIIPDGKAIVLSEGLLAGPTSVILSRDAKSVFVVTAGQNNDNVSGGQVVQGVHNLSHANHDLPDPELTPLGEEQAQALTTKFPELANNVELIISSPLQRTIQTALLAFPLKFKAGMQVLAWSEVQEASDLICDTGSQLPDIQARFHGLPVDFSLIEPDWYLKMTGLMPSILKQLTGPTVRSALLP
ncbi:hypothetical protein F52700_4901 [Fusarium sp. NRRL 52700]|nr:hypothetical protein F52700_4901 [Fusarium sp. NRRL 52700]